MRGIGFRGIVATAFAVLCLGLVASSAVAAYQFNPELSLRGSCGANALDPVEDPGCPNNPPEGPHPPSGRFNDPRSVALDLYGNLYVASTAGGTTAGRIDVFDDEGNFVTEMLNPHGPKSVAVDSKGNLYVFEQLTGEEGVVARYTPTTPYQPELGEIEYDFSSRAVVTTENVNAAGVAVDASNDHLYFSPTRGSGAGAFIEEFASADAGNGLLNTITHPKLNWNNWVTVDAERRRLFTSYCKDGFEDCGVLVLEADAPYDLLEEIDGSTVPAGEFRSEKGWIGVAVDEHTGHLFATDLEQTDNVYEFDEDYGYVDTTTFSGFQGGITLQIAVSNSPLNLSAVNHRHLFIPLPIAAGAVFAFAPPGVEAPEVEDVTAANISEREAQLRATVNPNGGATSYIFEYVTQAEFEQAEWANAQSAGAGTLPKGSLTKEVNASVRGLIPGTAYRFRVIATNEEGSDEDGPFGTFSTYADAPISGSGSCPNETLRLGSSSLLPDCRAYELVSPADTNGRPPKGVRFGGDRFPTLQASPAGSAVSFFTEGGPLPGTDGTGGFDGDPYRASRGAFGWNTVPTGPSGTETSVPAPGSSSPDQGYNFWSAGGQGSAVLDGQVTHYVRYPDGHDELLGQGSLGTAPTARGKLITEGGAHIIFQTKTEFPTLAQQLEPNAPPTGTAALYDRTPDGITHVVSLLPGNFTPAAGESANYLDASGDGAGIAFSIGNTVYLRLDNAVTYEIGEAIALADVSAGGSRVLYLKGGDLFAFDVASEEEIRFTETGDATVVNVSPDGSRAYFVSELVISGSGENPNGDIPQGGQQNLYLSEEGAIRFVGTVTVRDVEGRINAVGAQVDGLGLWVDAQAEQPARDPSRTNDDGSVLLFQSRANLDGYESGEFAQIYRYDSIGDRLHCVSCIPTGTPATGGAILETFAGGEGTAPPFSAYGFVPNLRSDGKRAFFESTEALVSTDTNDAQDVYEWEEEGVGSCTRPGGCVYLITSGQGLRDNYLYGVSRSGDDVFFTTEEILVGGDNDTSSIYDARVGGGFAEKTEEACEREGCRPPSDPAPGLTQWFNPADGTNENVVPRKPRPCPKGKHKVKRHGKVRCVKKKRSSKKQRRGAAGQKGGAR